MPDCYIMRSVFKAPQCLYRTAASGQSLSPHIGCMQEDQAWHLHQ